MIIQNSLFRTEQFLFSRVQPLLPWHMPEVVSGSGSLLKIPELLKQKHLRKVLVITTSGFIRRGTLLDFFEKLETAQVHYCIYDKVKPDPTIECIEEAVSLYQQENCQGIVAIGGGSVLDCAKVTGARIVRPEKTVHEMKGLLGVRKRIPPLFAVPTTAGTGSEVTVAAVVTDSVSHYKYAISDLCLLPAFAVLDPALTIGLSPDMTAATGMDALTHAVEAYINRFSNKQSDQHAIEAVALMFANLKRAYDNGTDMEARTNLLQGSYLAGLAFTRSYVGYVHAIAHAVGGLYGVPHGFANAIILPVVLEAYGSSIYKELSALANAIGIKGISHEDNAKAFIVAIRTMNHDMGIPDHLTMLRKKDIPQLVARAQKEANPSYPVPVIWDKKMLTQVFQQL